MCDTELSILDKENLEEVNNTLANVLNGDMKIVKHEHLVRNFQFQDRVVPMGEIYNIEVIYTCKMCKDNIKKTGVCSKDQIEHDQICIMFNRE